MIGATTENPSFEVISALLSRCQVYVLKPLDEKDLIHLLQNAMEKDEVIKRNFFILPQKRMKSVILCKFRIGPLVNFPTFQKGLILNLHKMTDSIRKILQIQVLRVEKHPSNKIFFENSLLTN